MKNKGFTLIEIMVVTGISMGLAAIVFSIFILMNTGFVKINMYASLKQQAQIAIESSQNYIEKAVSETINISSCQQGECLGDKITFQVPVVTNDAVAGTVFTNLGELKTGAYYLAANGDAIMVKDGYFDIYVNNNKKLVADVWAWQESGGGGGGGGGGGRGCFLADSPVLMADDSTKPIEQLKPGDKILAFNEKTGKIQKDEVEKLLVRKAKKYLIINGRIKVTPEHPFYHEGKWAKIGSLKIGDKLLNYKNQIEEIKSIEKVNQAVAVYNLTTKPSHTYFVYGILVHNKIIPNDPGGSDEIPGGGVFWSKLFNDMFAIKDTYADTIKNILNTKIMADKLISATFTSNATKKLITIKIRLENKQGLSGETIYYDAQSKVAPLN